MSAEPCFTCSEGCELDERGAPVASCPKSRFGCGHHCNCSWTQDACCWCGAEINDDGELVAVAEAAPP